MFSGGVLTDLGCQIKILFSRFRPPEYSEAKVKVMNTWYVAPGGMLQLVTEENKRKLHKFPVAVIAGN